MTATANKPKAKKAGNSDKFWRQDLPIIENGVVVKGGMFPSQRQWWNMPNFIKAMIGGFGSGKTIVGCKRAISLALENAPVPVAVVSPSFRVARETTVSTLQELLTGKESIYGPDFNWRYNGSTHVFRINFRGRCARIIVYSGDEPLSLRGPNLGAAYIDEPFIQKEDVFKQLIARVRHPDAKKREICLCGTPEELNWGYDLCEGELNDKHDVGVVHVSTRENLAVDSGYVGRLESAFDDVAAQAYVDGQFVNLSKGRVYYAFDRRCNVVDLDMPPGVELGCGMDFNVNPMAATVFWKAGSHMHFFDELELPNADTEYMCDELTERFGRNSAFQTLNKSALTTIYPDATGNARASSAPEGKTDFWYIGAAGFDIQAPYASPKRKDRYNAVNGKLKAKDQKSTLTISPRCKKLIKYLQSYTHENMRTVDHKMMSHLLDAFSYPVCYLFPVSRDEIRMMRLRGA